MSSTANDVVFWIAKDAAGVVRGGIIDEADSRTWCMVLTPCGWLTTSGSSAPPMSPEDAREALGEIAWRASNAGLVGDGLEPVPGPWRLEMAFGALMLR